MKLPKKKSPILFAIAFVLIILGALLLSVAFEIKKDETLIILDKERMGIEYLRDVKEVE